MKPTLYHPTIIQHSQNPHNFGKPNAFTHSCEGYNAQCGDHLHIYLSIEDNIIRQVSFVGDMCAVCKASASLMTQQLLDVACDQIDHFLHSFDQVLEGEDDSSLTSELNTFTLFKDFPTRHKCATLPWSTLKGAYLSQSQISTEK